jgi:hypothetical protein
MTRRAVVLVAVALAGTLVVESDALVQRVAIQRTGDVLDGCVQLHEPTLDLGAQPVAVRALRGHLDKVSFAADRAEIAGIQLTDLRGRVGQVRFRLLGGIDDIDVRDTDVAVRIDQHHLAQLLENLGIEGTVRIDHGDVNVELAGIPATVALHASAEQGAAIISATGLLAPLVRLRFDVPDITVQRITANGGALHIEATANGHPRQLACTAQKIVATRLQALHRVAELLPTP